MLIVLDAKWIGRVPLGHVNSLDGPLSLGLQRNKNSVVLSTAEADYVATDSCCAQLLWMRQTLKDYGYSMNYVPLLCDNGVPSRLLITLVSILEPNT
jgi:hypothetical protein